MKALVLLGPATIVDEDRMQVMLAESRRRILAGCTEPGNAPVGAPYPYIEETSSDPEHAHTY